METFDAPSELCRASPLYPPSFPPPPPFLFFPLDALFPPVVRKRRRKGGVDPSFAPSFLGSPSRRSLSVFLSTKLLDPPPPLSLEAHLSKSRRKMKQSSFPSSRSLGSCLCFPLRSSPSPREAPLFVLPPLALTPLFFFSPLYESPSPPHWRRGRSGSFFLGAGSFWTSPHQHAPGTPALLFPGRVPSLWKKGSRRLSLVPVFVICCLFTPLLTEPCASPSRRQINLLSPPAAL